MLKTDYTNDILDSSKNTERVYNIKNASGEIVNAGIKIEDITEYTQEGSKFGANDINATNEAVNNINVYVGEDKKLHFVNGEGADSVLPFNGGRKSDIDSAIYQTLSFSNGDLTGGKYYPCAFEDMKSIIGISKISSRGGFLALPPAEQNKTSLKISGNCAILNGSWYQGGLIDITAVGYNDALVDYEELKTATITFNKAIVAGGKDVTLAVPTFSRVYAITKIYTLNSVPAFSTQPSHDFMKVNNNNTITIYGGWYQDGYVNVDVVGV